MFKERKVLRKLLILGGVLLVLFLGFYITWEICVGSENRKYKLSGMEIDDFGYYLLEGDLGEYYRLIHVPFPYFELDGLQLTVSCGQDGEAMKKFFSGNDRVKGYPDLEVYSATFDIFPGRSLEDARYMIFLTVRDHSTGDTAMKMMCVDAQGNYYLAPGVMVDEETQNLARAFLDAEWRDYLVGIARAAWGEELFED